MLGQLATRIGSVGGDVVGIDILERGGGRAVDELTVVLPDVELVEMLVAELGQLPGVAVEDVRVVLRQPPDAATVALAVAARLAAAPSGRRSEVLCAELFEMFGAEWVALVDDAVPGHVEAHGPCPDPIWIAAFLAGSRHLGSDEQAAHAPSDLAWAAVGATSAVVLGRRAAPFLARERAQLQLLGQITAALEVPSSVG